jgi:hypothetical protein
MIASKRRAVRPRKVGLPSHFEKSVQAFESRQVRLPRDFGPQAGQPLRGSLAVVRRQGGHQVVDPHDLA